MLTEDSTGVSAGTAPLAPGVAPPEGRSGGSQQAAATVVGKVRGVVGPLLVSMLAYAVAYARQLGWRVFSLRQILGEPGDLYCDCSKAECREIGKHPRIRWKEGATNNVERVQSFWHPDSGHPNDGIGIVTGASSGIWVLDIDPKSGGFATLAALEAQHGALPRTATVITGSGGEHRYFRYPGPDHRNTAGALGPGLDTRGDGGYVVAPPSLHKSGARYRWKHRPLEAPLAEAPAWLLDLARKGGGAPASAPARRGQKSSQGMHASRVSVREATELLEEVLRHPLVKWAAENPEEVKYEAWRGIAVNLAVAATDHPEVQLAARHAFHEISEDDARYRWTETERAYNYAQESAERYGPMLFSTMVAAGAPPEMASSGAKCLVDAARQNLRMRKLSGRGGAA